MADTPPPELTPEPESEIPPAAAEASNPLLGGVGGSAVSTEPGSDASVNDIELTSTAAADGTPLDLGFILDIPLNVTVEVGRTKLLVQELLQLGQGSVIELDKQMGEPFEVLVNEKLVARGEIVVVNDRFGVRLTDIISPSERVKSLG